MKTIQVRRTRHAGYCWRNRDELISDVLQWTPTYGRAKAGRPARIYIWQLCEDTRCSPEELPEVMNDRDKWRERVGDIRASGTTWWWWWWWHHNHERWNRLMLTFQAFQLNIFFYFLYIFQFKFLFWKFPRETSILEKKHCHLIMDGKLSNNLIWANQFCEIWNSIAF